MNRSSREKAVLMGISPSQLDFIEKICAQLGIGQDDSRFKRALSSKHEACVFISMNKDQYIKSVKTRRETNRASRPVREVIAGLCAEPIAELRGKAIADLLGLYPEERSDGDPFFKVTEHGKTVRVGYAGLYRSIVQVTVECSEEYYPGEEDQKET